MFDQRIKDLKQKLIKEKLDGVLISAVSSVTYLTGYSNFAKDEREAYIFIGKNFGYIITDGRYSEAIKKAVPHLKLFERVNEKSIEDLFKKLKTKIKSLGIEEDNLTVSEYKFIKTHFKKLKHFNLEAHRSIKTDEEISKISEACRLGDQTFNYIFKKIRSGISEKELAFEIEFFIKKHGAEISFPPIVAFGKNSSVPHHQTGNSKLAKVDFMLLDFGVKFKDYCSDMTRTVVFGNPTKKQRDIYNVVLEAQKKAVEFLNLNIHRRKKVTGAEVDKVARDFLISQGYQSMPHSLGHGIGLEVHEHPGLSPNSKEILKEKMVFSIEPGIYIPDFGGVRIEDLFVFEKKRLRQLTASSQNIIQL